MNKWLMTLNNEKIEFDNFNNALSSFLKEISKYFWEHAYINKDATNVFVFDSACMPDALGGFFYHLNDDRIITDEEIVLEARLRMLCSYFGCDDPKDIKSNALKSINKSFDYHYEDEEIGYQVDIKVDYSPEEIVTELKAGYGDSYLHTNAFIMDDENKKYFFKSHQVCNISSRKSDLGKVADLDITLEKTK